MKPMAFLNPGNYELFKRMKEIYIQKICNFAIHSTDW